MDVQRGSKYSNVIFVACLLVSLIMTAAYTSKLVSNAVPVPKQLPFKSMAELVQRNDYIWGTTVGGSFENLLKVFFTRLQLIHFLQIWIFIKVLKGE